MRKRKNSVQSIVATLVLALGVATASGQKSLLPPIQGTLGTNSPAVSNATTVNIHYHNSAAAQGVETVGPTMAGSTRPKAISTPRRASSNPDQLVRRAESGDRAAQLELAWLYENGRDFEKSDGLALYWFRKAAAQNEPEAMFSVGYYTYYGRYTRQDFSEAIRWFRRGADAGHAPSQPILA